MTDKLHRLRADIEQNGDFSAPVEGHGEMTVSEILKLVEARKLPVSALAAIPVGLERHDVRQGFLETISREPVTTASLSNASIELHRMMLLRNDYLADIGDGRGYRLASEIVNEIMTDDGWRLIIAMICLQMYRDAGLAQARQ